MPEESTNNSTEGGPQANPSRSRSSSGSGDSGGGGNAGKTFKVIALIVAAAMAIAANTMLAWEIVPDKYHTLIGCAIPLLMVGMIMAGAAGENPQGGLKLINILLWILAMFLGFIVMPIKESTLRAIAKAEAQRTAMQQGIRPPNSSFSTWPIIDITPDAQEVVRLEPADYRIEFDTDQPFTAGITGRYEGGQLWTKPIPVNNRPHCSPWCIRVQTANEWLFVGTGKGGGTFPVRYRILTRSHPEARWRPYIATEKVQPSA